MFTAVVVYTWNTWLGCARGGEETQIHDRKYNVSKYDKTMMSFDKIFDLTTGVYFNFYNNH